MQPRPAYCVTFLLCKYFQHEQCAQSFPMGENGKERCLGGVTRVWTWAAWCRNKGDRTRCTVETAKQSSERLKAEGEGLCQACCSNWQWKTSRLTAKKYPWVWRMVNGTSEERGTTATVDVRQTGSWKPRRKRKKITGHEHHQPVRMVGSWNPRT